MNVLKKSTFSMALLTACAMPGFAESISEERIKELVLEAIIENPSIVIDAINLYQEQQEQERQAAAAAGLAAFQAEITLAEDAPVFGNVEGDITIVEFFDYNCGYCKRVASAVEELVASDDQLRIVYREWPILSEDSVIAARASLAAMEQDKYEEFHKALMTERRVDQNAVVRVAQTLNLDIPRLEQDMNRIETRDHIQKSREYADALGFTGTPAFLIGTELVPGAVSLEQLRAIVAAERAKLEN